MFRNNINLYTPYTVRLFSLVIEEYTKAEHPGLWGDFFKKRKFLILDF